MSSWAKYLSVLLAIIITVFFPMGCQSNKVESTITPSNGGTATFESISIAIPAQGVSSNSKISISVMENPPALIEGLSKEEQAAMPSTYCFLGDVYDIILDADLQEPATIILKYSAQDIPAGFTAADLAVAHYVDGQWQVVEGQIDEARQTVTAQLEHFSPVGLILGAAGLFLTGALIIYYSLLTKPAFIGTAHKYLTPEDESIIAAVTSGQFIVDASNSRLLLNGVKLKPKGRSMLSRPKTGAEMMDNPEGMCEDFSNLFGSLLIAAGYPVRAVGGEATYTVGGKTISGGHAWIEVLIEGNVYYVDTFDAGNAVTLRPISEARQSLQLRPGKMWGKQPDGKVIKSVKYDTMWPLLGTWKLTRTGINIAVNIPDIVLNRVLDDDPTWEFFRTESGKLQWDYGNKEQWFNTLGQTVTRGVSIVTEDENSIWCSVDGDGTIYVESLPFGFDFILSLGNKENKKIEQISITYEDEVMLKLTGKKTANVSITVNVKGKYLATREVINSSTGLKEETQIWKDINQREIIATFTAEKQE